MGCVSSTADRFALEAESLRATKLYFRLDKLPVSVRATRKGRGIEVHAVGIAQIGLLSALEQGFQMRRFWIVDGTVSVREGLFVGAFELKCFRGVSEDESSFADAKVLAKPCTAEFTVLDQATGPPAFHSPVKRFIQSVVSEGLIEEDKPDFSAMQIPTPNNTPPKRYYEAHKGYVPEAITPPKLYAPDAMRQQSESGHGTYNFKVMHVPTPKSQGIKVMSLREFAGTRTTSSEQLEHVDAHAADDGAVLRLSILHEWTRGLRAALHQVITASGFRVVLARLSFTTSSSKRVIKDTLWLATSEADNAADGPMRSPTSNFLESADLQKEGHKPRVVSELQELFKVLAQGTEPSSPKLSAVKSGITEEGQIDLDIATLLRSQDVKPDLELPWALQSPASSLPYRLQAMPDEGTQFDGILKFCGAGMARTRDKNEPVLELSTYFVSSKDATSKRSITSLLEQTESFAEFITQYHPTMRRLTIFKVFLNGILPSGQRAGARVTAEQLLCKPGNGLLAKDSATVIRELKEIHLCDVVNWNTYLLLSKVNKGPDSDEERWILQSELSSSRMSMDDFQVASLEEVFIKTALGKLVCDMLATWKGAGVAELSIQSVEVVFDRSKLEWIAGEHRAVMDVIVSICSSVTSTSEGEFNYVSSTTSESGSYISL